MGPTETTLIYVRQSLDRDGDGAAVDRQETACQEYAARRGLTVLEVISDNDVSASSRKPRPGFERVLAALQRGDAGSVTVYALDRIARRVTDLERLTDIGAPIFSVNDGGADLSTSGGRAMASVLVTFARAEVERKSERQRSAALARAKAGKPHAGGPRTPGYRPGLTAVEPTEAELIRAGYSTLLAGGSLRSIARSWNAGGMTTAHGGRWDSTSVRGALRNPRYAAQSVYRARGATPEVIGPGSWPPIVSVDVWRSAVAVLADPARRTTPDTARRYLLSGLARCGRCGAGIITGRNQHGTRTYRCATRPGHLSRSAEPVDTFVTEVIAARLRRPDAAGMLARTEVDTQPARDELAALRIRLDELADLHVDGSITAGQLARGTERARTRITELERALAASVADERTRPVVTSADPASAFVAADLDARRAVITALATVTIHGPGKGARTFDPATVVVEPR